MGAPSAELVATSQTSASSSSASFTQPCALVPFALKRDRTFSSWKAVQEHDKAMSSLRSVGEFVSLQRELDQTCAEVDALETQLMAAYGVERLDDDEDASDEIVAEGMADVEDAEEEE